ncbi:MAG: DNA repair protein RecN [Alphaproteobacteria bacterium]|nr:DNA repair protein RecN [Alphaproteobacteria bacterium]
MLQHLSIRDIVLIDQANLSFGPGLSALTGETGAGKSILLDALGLALGARSDSSLIRKGADQASVTATFSLEKLDSLPGLLDAHEITVEAGENLLLRRTVGADGRSRAFLNDQPVSIGLLRQVGDAIVEIHGQFERFSLAEPANQRRALDAFAGVEKDLDKLSHLFNDWQSAVAEHSAAAQALNASASQAEELRATLEELDKLDPAEGEQEELTSRRELLQNAGRLVETFNSASTSLSGEDGAETLLQRAARLLERDNEIAGGRLTPVIAAIDKASAELAEAVLELNSVAHALDTDTGDLETVEERLFALLAAARRHSATADDLPQIRRDIEMKLAAIDGRDNQLDTLAKAVETSRRAYSEAGEALSRKRQKAARKLDTRIAKEFAPLKLDNATLTTRIHRMDEESWSAVGLDAVHFDVATNPGAEPGPLGKIASGGELSRFMLALKVVLAGTSGAGTIVFDEVDTGVGGATAAAVGERLAELAASGDGQQILVVTHSPQVAAAAREHLRVEKQSDGKSATKSVMTKVVRLEEDERREEIARMLSGARITDEARAAADKLMDRGAPPVRATA